MRAEIQAARRAPVGADFSDSSIANFCCNNWQQQTGTGAAMRAGGLTTIVAASLVMGGAAWSACPPGQSRGQSRNCVDLGSVPQISQEIVAGERAAAPPKTAPASTPAPAYTGPVVGLSRTVRQAPTFGYRWAID
jgi:hypothetical protein